MTRSALTPDTRNLKPIKRAANLLNNSHKGDPNYNFKKKELLSETRTPINNKIFTEGKYIDRYKIVKNLFVEWGTERCPTHLVRPTFPELYPPNKLLLSRQKKIAAYSDQGHVCDNTMIMAFLAKDLKGVNNNSLEKYFKNIDKDRVEVAEKSRLFDLKYLLALINSKLIWYYMKYKSKGKIDFYPNDWKKIPVKNISDKRQIPFIRKTEQMLELNNQINSNTNQFVSFIESSYNPKSTTKKLR